MRVEEGKKRGVCEIVSNKELPIAKFGIVGPTTVSVPVGQSVKRESVGD